VFPGVWRGKQKRDGEAKWKKALLPTLGTAKHTKPLMKAASGWNGDGNGTDEFGFSALPGGDGDSDGYFGSVGNNGYWWSASERNPVRAYSWNIGCIADIVICDDYTKFNLFSVRCIQDD
jgi:uncharacterized protein (TIGR02145 family)